MTRSERKYGSGYGKATAAKPELRTFLDLYLVDYRETPGWQAIHCPSPNHPDNSASASLSLSEQAWKCHACTAGGDVYSLIMEVLDCDFPTARSAAQAVVGDGPESVRGGNGGQPGGEVRAGGSRTRPRYRRSAPARLRRARDDHAGA